MKLNGAVVALIVVLSLVLGVAGIGVSSYITYKNYGVTAETNLKNERLNNQNILAQYEQKVLEAAQVPDMARDDIIKVYREAMSGRYGKDGSKAVFQFISEQNPNVSPALYTKLQNIIDSGRTDFANSQTKMLDLRRQYEAKLEYVWSGFWLGVAGYPKINLDEYKPIITDRVEATFKAGKETTPIKLR